MDTTFFPADIHVEANREALTQKARRRHRVILSDSEVDSDVEEDEAPLTTQVSEERPLSSSSERRQLPDLACGTGPVYNAGEPSVCYMSVRDDPKSEARESQVRVGSFEPEFFYCQ